MAGRLLVVDFSDDQRSLACEELCAAAQDFVLATLHVNLDQMWLRTTGSDEVVQGDRAYGYDLAFSGDGAVAVRFHATTRLDHSAAPKRDSLVAGRRPYRTMYRSKAICHSTALSVLYESRNIFGIAIKGDNATRIAYEPCRTQRDASDVASNVIDNHARPNRREDRALHARFMSALPIGPLAWETKAHPHPLREPGLNLHPDLALYEALEVIEGARYGLVALQNSFYASPLENGAQAIEQGIRRFDQRGPHN